MPRPSNELRNGLFPFSHRGLRRRSLLGNRSLRRRARRGPEHRLASLNSTPFSNSDHKPQAGFLEKTGLTERETEREEWDSEQMAGGPIRSKWRSGPVHASSSSARRCAWSIDLRSEKRRARGRANARACARPRGARVARQGPAPGTANDHMIRLPSRDLSGMFQFASSAVPKPGRENAAQPATAGHCGLNPVLPTNAL